MRSTMEMSSRDQWVPPSACVTLRQSFIGRNTWVARVKSGRASRRVRGSRVCASINDMLGLRRTILEVLYFARYSCSRYLGL